MWNPSSAASLVIWRISEGGHGRRDLTSADVRFLSVYSYLIVYRPETKPLQIVAILHAHRDVAKFLPQRGI